MEQTPHTSSGGHLIVFEGIDGAGKSTQVSLAFEVLQDKGYNCKRLQEPTEGLYGRQIQQLYQEGRDRISAMEEYELFLKDRMEDVEKNIRPALERGMVVLLDRYYYSTMAYQGARGIDPEFIKRENEKFAPKPDLVTYLDIPVSITGERIQNHRKDMVNLFEKAHYLEKVKAHFDAIKEDNFVRIDATGSVAEVHKKIMNAIRSVLNRA